MWQREVENGKKHGLLGQTHGVREMTERVIFGNIRTRMMLRLLVGILLGTTEMDGRGQARLLTGPCTA